MRTRLRSGWTATALLTITTLAIWLPDINLPLGNSDDGRLVAFSGLHARTFWDLGPLESRLGARVDPFVRPEFGVEPRSAAPVEATTYAHHPPLKEFLSIASSGLLGNSLPALRVPIFLLGAATLLFMASLLRACGIRWGPTLLAMGAMSCTGFFYVYGRLGVSFSLLVASAAAVAWIRKSERPTRWHSSVSADSPLSPQCNRGSRSLRSDRWRCGSSRIGFANGAVRAAWRHRVNHCANWSSQAGPLR